MAGSRRRLALAAILLTVALTGCVDEGAGGKDSAFGQLSISRVAPTETEIETKAGNSLSFTVQCNGRVDADRLGAEWRRVVLGDGITEMNRSSVDADGTHTWSVTFNRSRTQTIEASCISFDGDQSDWISWSVEVDEAQDGSAENDETNDATANPRRQTGKAS